jgi:flavin reductase (DIM6/NTAB) family NADH-FMN oxidoreductase RutF
MKTATKEIPAYKLMYLDQVYLLTTAHGAKEKGFKPHIIPQLWATPVSFRPPLIAVAVAKDRFTHHILMETKEFVLNIPGSELAPRVWACAPPGDGGDKFTRSKLTPIKAKKVKAPLVKECLGAIECKVVGKIDAGDHTVFIGEAVATHKFKTGTVMINAAGHHEFKV